MADVPSEPTMEIGNHGLRQFAGFVREEFIDDLKGNQKFDIFREMGENDAIVSGTLRAIELLMRQVDWPVKPASRDRADLRRAQFLREVIEDLDPMWDWETTLSDILSMIQFGFSVHEIVYKRRDGTNSMFNDNRLGWKRLPIRRQETLHRWEFDDENNDLEGFVQLTDLGERNEIPIEKTLLFRPSGSRGNPEGSSVLRNAYRSWFFKKRIQEIECYSDDTEILTKDGWKGIDSLTTEDKVCTLNPDNHKIEYHKPKKIHKDHYSGPMFHQESRFVDLLVTPNHKMYNRPKYQDEFEFTRADNLVKVTAYKRTGEWEGQERATFTIPGIGDRADTQQDITVPMDDWLRFFGFYLAEGWFENSGNNKVAISQKKGDNLEWIKDVIDRLGFNWWQTQQSSGENRQKVYVSNRQLHDYLQKFGKAHEKFIPTELKQLSKRQLKILFDAMLRGDGTAPAGTDQYITVSEQLKDDVCELILKIGKAPNVSVKRFSSEEGGSNDGFGKTWRKCYNITATKGWENGNIVNSHGTDGRTWEQYDGQVFCPEMPVNHIVYTRRNGKCVWSGNSIGIERDLAGLPKALVPPELLAPADELTSEQQNIIDEVKKIVRNVRRDEQEGVVFPSSYDEDGNLRYDFELLSSGGERQFDTNEIIERYNKEIVMTAMADFMLIGHEQTGSFALASAKTNLFTVALGAWLDTIQDVFNRKAIPQLFRLNGMTRGPYPKLNHSDVESIDPDVLSDFFQQMRQAGFDFSGSEAIEDWVLDQLNAPRPEDRPSDNTPADDGVDTPNESGSNPPDSPQNPPDSQEDVPTPSVMEGE